MDTKPVQGQRATQTDAAELRDMQKRWGTVYLFAYLAVVASALAFIFRPFLLSDRMLYSNDVITFGMFVRSFLREHLISGLSPPQWNPFTCCGLPFVDAIHSGIFYPLTVVDLVGNIYRAPGTTSCCTTSWQACLPTWPVDN